jgi:transcriptional regulator
MHVCDALRKCINRSVLRKNPRKVNFPFASTGDKKLTESLDVMQGTLVLLILKALSLEPIHAWGISERIQRMSGDVFQIGQGSLYPAVHRLENRGWVMSYWRTTDNNRLARYYQLTPAGKHTLVKELERWRSYARAVDLVIGPG